ncbi:MAG: single-stranded DNA-binding protein [Flavobacteriales bacterium]|nr:single-stranded DNA-binding protein [Flavobacteriales bacterium]
MKGLNRVSLIGHLGKDPEYKEISGELQVAKMTLATTETYRDKEGILKAQTDWHSLVMWGKLAQVAQKHLKKGSHLFIEGKLKFRKYEDKSGQIKYVSEVIVENILML